MELNLQDLCMIEIINDLEHYPPDLLARLPARFRRQLLCNLPVLDLCKLEHTPVARGVEINSIWEELYPPFLKRFSRLPDLPEKDSGIHVDWKHEYLAVVIDYIVRNKPNANLEPHEDFKYRYTIVDCLIAIRARKLLGMCDPVILKDSETGKEGESWWNKHQTPLIFYDDDKVTTKRHIELREATGKDSLALLKMLADTCHFRPKTFNVDHTTIELWGSPLLQYRHIAKVLKTLLAEVEEFSVYISFLPRYTDFPSISQIPTQVSKAIFSHPNPKLKSLRLSFSYPGVMEKDISDYMRGFSPYLYAVPSARTCHITATFPHLTKIYINGNLDKSSVSTVAMMIEQQTLLEQLEFPNFHPEGLAELNTDVTYVIEPIVVALSRIFLKPKFEALIMEQSHIHPSMVMHILSGFLTSPCHHKQKLCIDHFHMTPTLNVRYEKPYLEHPASSCALQHKFLWPGKGTDLKLIGTLFPLVFKFPLVQMHTFLVGFYPKRGSNVLHLAAEHGNFFVTTFILVYFSECDSLQDDLNAILRIRTLHTFTVFPYNAVQVGYVSTTLQRQPNLLTLNLGGQHPESEAAMVKLFNNVFAFPQLSEFTLDMSFSSFKISDSDCLVLHECWQNIAAGKQLKELIIYCTELVTQEVLYSLVRDVAVTVSFVDKWSMFDVDY